MFIPYFKSLKEAQEYLDTTYNLPVWRLVVHYRSDNVIKISDWAWKRK